MRFVIESSTKTGRLTLNRKITNATTNLPCVPHCRLLSRNCNISRSAVQVSADEISFLIKQFIHFAPRALDLDAPPSFCSAVGGLVSNVILWRQQAFELRSKLDNFLL